MLMIQVFKWKPNAYKQSESKHLEVCRKIRVASLISMGIPLIKRLGVSESAFGVRYKTSKTELVKVIEMCVDC